MAGGRSCTILRLRCSSLGRATNQSGGGSERGLEHLQQARYNAHALKTRQYTARGDGIGPPACALFAAALQFFLVRAVFCTIRGAKCDASAAAHGISADAHEYTTAKNFLPRPPFSHCAAARTLPPLPVDFATGPAVARRRAVDTPRPRLLPTVPAAPSRCIDPPPSPPTGTRPALLPASPAPSPLHTLCRRRHVIVVEPTVNMAQPRCSPVCSQGMRLRRSPSFCRFFCY
jgi:hypothetical protein